MMMDEEMRKRVEATRAGLDSALDWLNDAEAELVRVQEATAKVKAFTAQVVLEAP